MRHSRARRELLKTARELISCGLVLRHGTSGNASVRVKDGFVITPTGVPFATMKIDELVDLDAAGAPRPGQLAPSSEWRFHRDIYRSRPDAGAIVHAHPLFATSLACLRQSIPAVHYMVAAAGGDSIRCADYATFGSEALSRNALAALEGRRACLLANHGMIAFGESLDAALTLAVEVENLAAQYWHARQLGRSVVLDAKEMRKVLTRFGTYGQQRPPPAVAAGAGRSLRDQLLSLERRLMGPQRRRESTALGPVLASDFVEVGSSGRVYDRRAALAAMRAGPAVRPALKDFRLLELAPDCVLVRYRAETSEGRSERTSIWVQREGEWQMVFHQGTAVPGERG